MAPGAVVSSQAKRVDRSCEWCGGRGQCLTGPRCQPCKGTGQRPALRRLGGLDTRTAAELRDWRSSDEGRAALARWMWAELAAEARRPVVAAQIDAMHRALDAEARAEARARGIARWRAAAGLPSFPDSTSATDPSGGGGAAPALGAGASLTAPVARSGALDVSGCVESSSVAPEGNQAASVAGAAVVAEGGGAPLDTGRDTLAAALGGRR